jgi:hypothetical protein
MTCFLEIRTGDRRHDKSERVFNRQTTQTEHIEESELCFCSRDGVVEYRKTSVKAAEKAFSTHSHSTPPDAGESLRISNMFFERICSGHAGVSIYTFHLVVYSKKRQTAADNSCTVSDDVLNEQRRDGTPWVANSEF